MRSVDVLREVRLLAATGLDRRKSSTTGSRVFNVTCNGVMLHQNVDIFKEAGDANAVTKTSYHLKPSAQGELSLTFEPVVNYALISGIAVFDESQ